MLACGRPQPKHIGASHDAITASHRCSTSRRSTPAVRRNRRSDMPQTLRNDTDKPTTACCSPGPIPRAAQNRQSARGALMEAERSYEPDLPEAAFFLASAIAALPSGLAAEFPGSLALATVALQFR